MSKTLSEHIKQVMREALDDAKAAKQPSAPAPTPPTASTSTPEPTDGSGSADEKQEKLANADIETKDVVETLNSIRSGRSFKDSAVAGPMEQYIDKLSAAEKTALYAFLSGLAQIVTGQVPGDSAIDPSDQPANVEMKKQASGAPDGGTQRKTIKPNVTQARPMVPKKKPTGLEDTTPPAPIVPRAR